MLPRQLSWQRIRLQCRRPWFNSWVRKIHWQRDRLPTPVFLGFSCGSAGKESSCNAGDLSSKPGLGRSPGEGKGYPLQYSDPENSMDCIARGVSKSRTRLSDFHFHLNVQVKGYGRQCSWPTNRFTSSSLPESLCSVFQQCFQTKMYTFPRLSQLESGLNSVLINKIL